MGMQEQERLFYLESLASRLRPVPLQRHSVIPTSGGGNLTAWHDHPLERSWCLHGHRSTGAGAEEVTTCGARQTGAAHCALLASGACGSCNQHVEGMGWQCTSTSIIWLGCSGGKA